MTYIENKIKFEELKITEAKTNHILHLLLTLLTGGLWVIVWIIVGMTNEQKRSNASNNIRNLLKHSSQINKKGDR